MDHGRRPAIIEVGTVNRDGRYCQIHGWTLATCLAQCDCHIHSDTGQVGLLQDHAGGRLGLITYRPDCDCCQPWEADELEAIERDTAIDLTL